MPDVFLHMNKPSTAANVGTVHVQQYTHLDIWQFNNNLVRQQTKAWNKKWSIRAHVCSELFPVCISWQQYYNYLWIPCLMWNRKAISGNSCSCAHNCLWKQMAKQSSAYLFYQDKINIANTGPVNDCWFLYRMVSAPTLPQHETVSVRTNTDECEECRLTSQHVPQLQSHG